MVNATFTASTLTGRTFLWYSGLSVDTSQVPGYNASYTMSANSGAGGPIGCPPTKASCGGDPNFWTAEVGDYIQAVAGSGQQATSLLWSSIGQTQDNLGSLTPKDIQNEYLSVVPPAARSTVLFNDWIIGAEYHGITNQTQNQYDIAFGTLLSRMEYNGGWFGTEKAAVKLLWVSDLETATSRPISRQQSP